MSFRDMGSGGIMANEMRPPQQPQQPQHQQMQQPMQQDITPEKQKAVSTRRKKKAATA